MKKGGSFFWGVVLGTMAGLIVGMILTPRKEEKIKNILEKKTEELRNNLQEIGKQIGKKVHKIKSNFESKWKKNKIEKMDQVEDELGT
ncbi:YtxH domain-containing protein [Blattabacterium sp. (Nauphoeta cinerea)]|uniref:YtxH domain-containing protein n=1 Tax=Blattabacterium sp. (Nauphoeta cinerea) TaxID=1316444 RepID=UPI00042903ED|nr:YtxH domain-containing protein [Blattabacterium sp. (Nauphoeta cinerea)]